MDQFFQYIRRDIALVLRVVLDQVEDTADLLLRELAAHGSHDVLKRLFSGVFAKDEVALSANEPGREVLVGEWVFKDRCDVDAALVRKGEFPGYGFVPGEGNPGNTSPP